MKSFKILLFAASVCAATMTSCEDFLNRKPLDQGADVSYFKSPEHFKAYANSLYSSLITFKDKSEEGNDLLHVRNTIGMGEEAPVAADGDNYTNQYNNIRSCNRLLSYAEAYVGNKEEIAQYVAEAYFFRAYCHFYLMRRYGGIVLSTHVMETDSPELQGNRNSRYEVTAQILADLQVAIEGLPEEKKISSTDKGHVSKEAAKTFKSRVLLYEATWEKYVGDTTDGDGVNSGAGSAKPVDYPSIEVMLAEAVKLTEEVITEAETGTFELFTGFTSTFDNPYITALDLNPEKRDWSPYYLFTLEDINNGVKSNPLGWTKKENKEYLLSKHYDYNLGTITTGGSGNTWCQNIEGYSAPNRKMVDMYLCKNGKPIRYADGRVNPQFDGYDGLSSEFNNRDNRMTSLVYIMGDSYWGYETTGGFNSAGGANYEVYNYGIMDGNKPDDMVGAKLEHYVTLSRGTQGGYANRKFHSESTNLQRELAFNYPIIRLSEVYLIFAEAKAELGTITQEDLDRSINIIRVKRGGIAPLSSALVQSFGSTLLDEIRRERTVELFIEGFRMDDIKRWGIAEQEENINVESRVVTPNSELRSVRNPYELASFPHIFDDDLYQGSWPFGINETGENGVQYALIIEKRSNGFKRRNYLHPLPTDEIKLNPNLLQNP